ncbi:MAG TPA: ABC transporter permease [Thermoanaerobaculia bacterium]|nr:ABC transporter permease [Thermoanaerobaculia bacterium]
MTGFLLRRVAASALLLLLVLTATFLLLHLAPGDPLGLLAHPRVPPEQREALRQLWGLDQPLAARYLRWLGGVVRGDWGTSFLFRRPAGAVLLAALPNTLLLGGAALLVQLVVAVPLGVAAGRRPGSPLDHGIRVGSLLLYSLPTFWVGLMALLLFAYGLGLFPPSHLHGVGAESLSPGLRVLDLLHHLALPALVLGLTSAGGLLRFVRSSVLEAMGQPHVLAARARGLSERRVVWVHGLGSALGPLLQLLGLSLPALLGGALVTEVVFSWPGLGRLAWSAMLARDYPLILAVTAWSAALVLVGNLLADLLQAAADPRVREATHAV